MRNNGDNDDTHNGDEGDRSRNEELINNMPPEDKRDIRPAQERQVSKLSPQEKATLKKCEAVIRESIGSSFVLGAALRTIRNQRLHRGKGYLRFNHYTQAEWGISASRARQLIGAAEVYADVLNNTPVLPKNEAQTRALVKLDTESRRSAWNRAVELSHGAPTQDVVLNAVRQMIKWVKEDPEHQQDFWMLFRELSSRIDETSRWINEHSNELQGEVNEEAKRHLERLAGAIRDLLKFGRA